MKICNVPSDLQFRSVLQHEQRGSLFGYLPMLVEAFAGVAALERDVSYFCSKL